MSRRSQTAATGFSLTEVLVVLAVLALLTTLAAPSFKGLRQKHQMQSQAEQLQASLMLARGEALRRQKRVTLCIRNAAEACAAQGSWAQGWVVFVDDNHNTLREPHETVLQLHAAAPAFLTFKGNTTVQRYVSYGPNGRSQSRSGAFQAGTISLCGPRQPDAWRLVVNAVGKPRLERVKKGTETDC